MLRIRTYVAPSGISGLGLFFAEDYPVGTEVWRYQEGFDRRLTPAELDALPALAQEHVKVFGWLSRHSGLWVVPMDADRHVNHQDDANTVEVCVEGEEEGLTVTSRTVKAGEEVTANYGSFDADGVTIDRPVTACRLSSVGRASVL